MNKLYIYIYIYSNIKEYYNSVLNFKMVFKYFTTSYVCFSPKIIYIYIYIYIICVLQDIYLFNLTILLYFYNLSLINNQPLGKYKINNNVKLDAFI